MPPIAFALNGRNEVKEIQLEVVAGPKAVPRVGLQEVVLPEKWQD